MVIGAGNVDTDNHTLNQNLTATPTLVFNDGTCRHILTSTSMLQVGHTHIHIDLRREKLTQVHLVPIKVAVSQDRSSSM